MGLSVNAGDFKCNHHACEPLKPPDTNVMLSVNVIFTRGNYGSLNTSITLGIRGPGGTDPAAFQIRQAAAFITSDALNVDGRVFP